jgi:hypothetical protein
LLKDLLGFLKTKIFFVHKSFFDKNEKIEKHFVSKITVRAEKIKKNAITIFEIPKNIKNGEFLSWQIFSFLKLKCEKSRFFFQNTFFPKIDFEEQKNKTFFNEELSFFSF